MHRSLRMGRNKKGKKKGLGLRADLPRFLYHPFAAGGGGKARERKKKGGERGMTTLLAASSVQPANSIDTGKKE